MPAQLTRATPDDLQSVTALVAAFHAEEGITQSDDQRQQALVPLLEGSPLGEIYLVGPAKAPIGYIAISHGYSIEFGGPDAFIDELYVRKAIRGRGLGSEVIDAVSLRLKSNGTKMLHLEVHKTNDRAAGLYKRRGFAIRDGYNLMSLRLG